MGFEDTSPLMTDNEGLDSGFGGAAQTSEKMHSPRESVEAVETEMPEDAERATSANKTKGKMRNAKASLSLKPPDESQSQPRRQSSRKKKKTDLDPEMVREQRQKKSMEKVAEWLMKVPIEDDQELQTRTEDTCNSENSDSCSSTSTLDVKLYKSDVKPKRVDHAKALEDQVFGAVYKRERRGNRSKSLPANVLVKPVNDTCTDILEEAEQTVICEKESDEKYAEDAGSDNNDGKDEVRKCVSESKAPPPEKKPKRSTRNALQKVDSDLQAQANVQGSLQKKTDKRRGKSARMPKPLVLVGIQNEETSPKTRPPSKDIQVHIENYPSSEDQGTPLMRSTRRSRRLQLFTEEVQEGHKKAQAATNTPGKDHNVAKQSEGAAGGTLKNTASPQSEHGTKAAKRNGCIYDEDLGGIENMEFGERTEAAPSSQEFVADGPCAETLSEEGAAGFTPVVPSTTNASEAAVAGPDPLKVDIELETLACGTKSAATENEEDKNDSEMDTEQLLRSFKATKRKSFHLGRPNGKRSRSSDEENVHNTVAEENSGPSLEVKCAKQQVIKESDITDQDALRDTDNWSCSDLIPPSNSPGLQRKTVLKKQDQVNVDQLIGDTGGSVQDNAGNGLLGNSISSSLSPNRVSKREIDSPHLCVVAQVVDSGLCFQTELSEANEREDLNELDCTLRDSSKVEIRDDISSENSAATGKHCSVNTVDSSLTPDGLGAPDDHLKTNRSAELSVHSSIKSNPRKRRRTKRLESLSESDCSGSNDELPSLAQIFRTSPPRSGAQDQKESSGAQTRPPACPSPDCVSSSQASVDLFDPPEECKLIKTVV